jgi:hypothetical protein
MPNLAGTTVRSEIFRRPGWNREGLPIITAVHPGREAGDARQRSLWHGLADAHGEG